MTRVNLMPVLAGHERIRLTALVDINQPAAETLARTYGVPHALGSLDALTKDLVDAVIIATPPSLHAPQAIELAGRGLHVFVEKPMAVSRADGELMIRAAETAGVTLAVGLYRRLLPSVRLLRGLMASGIVGRPVAVDIEEGGEYGWQLATLANLTPRLGGGGVLIDIGSHVLDQVLFLMPGAARLISYSDNSRGGVETDSLMRLVLSDRGSEIPCRVELSRTREMRNSIRIECERGALELSRGEFSSVTVQFADMPVSDPISGVRPTRISARWGDEQPPNGHQVFRNEIDDWVDAMAGRSELQLSGDSALKTVQLIEEAYQTRKPMAESWVEEGLTTPVSPRRSAALRKRRVLLTGASGFIGGRAAEILSLREQCDVRALVHSPSRAARLARLPVEMVTGDICSADDVAKAIEGCDAVVHCAVGNSWRRAETRRTTVDGTRTLAEVATRLGVRKFVHLSSIAVHGKVTSDAFDENTPLVEPNEAGYPGDKRAAEDAIAQFVRRGLPAVILRPARVYGPYSKTFITRPLQHLVRGQLVLAGPIHGPASMVYVDNVVESILCALEGDGSPIVGQAFNVTDPEQLSWDEFYSYFASALGATLHRSQVIAPRTVAPAGGVISQWAKGIREIAMSAEVRALAKKCLSTDPVGAFPRKLWEDVPAFRSRVQTVMGLSDATVYRPIVSDQPTNLVFETESALVVGTKAEKLLGLRPAVPRDRAMELTLKWFKDSRVC